MLLRLAYLSVTNVALFAWNQRAVGRRHRVRALTVGHCTNTGPDWTGSGGQFLGWRTGSSFPGNDYGIIRYVDGVVAPPGRHGGVVTGLNVTVNYQEGSVYGMSRPRSAPSPVTAVARCSRATSRWASLLAAAATCRSGGQTFFEPVVEAMYNYGVWVY